MRGMKTTSEPDTESGTDPDMRTRKALFIRTLTIFGVKVWRTGVGRTLERDT